MKKFAGNKLRAFSMAYAIVSLVVVAVSIIGLTPVLTRKLGGISGGNSLFAPKVRGWYESYNAPDTGTLYCKTCKDNDNKNPKEPWPQKPSYTEKIKPDEAGNPEFNPYVEHPETELIPFERYCTNKDTCGYPKEKWDEDELALAPDKQPDERRPHKCKGGKCKFKPTQGIKDYHMYAVGSGGASGSAVKNKDISNDLKGKFSVNPPAKPLSVGKYTYSGDEADKYEIKADFIDVYKVKDNDPDFNLSSARGDFYTVGEVTDDIRADHISDGNAVGKYNEMQGNFRAYPTKAWNKKLAQSSSEQIKKILKDKKALAPDNIVYRFYLYTKQVGADNYQNPKYTLMPEWLKMDGQEEKYPCDKELGTECPPEPNPSTTPIGYPDKPIIDEYSTVVALACSQSGGGGAGVSYSKKVVCEKDKPTSCLRGNNDSTDFTYDKGTKKDDCSKISGVSITSRSMAPICLKQEHNASCMKEGNSVTADSKDYCTNSVGGIWQDRYCEYYASYTNRVCKYKPYVGPYVICTCEQKKLADRCKNNDDINTECYPVAHNVPIDDYATSDNENLLNQLEKDEKDGVSTEFVQEVAVEGAETVLSETYVREYNDDTSARLEALLATQDLEDAGEAMADQIRTTDSAAAYLSALASLREAKSAEDFISGLAGNLNALRIQNAQIENQNLYAVHHYAGGTPSCHAWRARTRIAPGGSYGKGVCIYTKANIKRGELTEIISESSTDPVRKPDKKLEHSCKGSNGENGDGARVKINNYEITATGGGGGTGGAIRNCDVCLQNAPINGKRGANATTNPQNIPADKGGSFVNTNRNSSDAPNPELGIGTDKTDGMYNWHYVWYIPIVTKHLMFGTSGESGDELNDKITLSAEAFLEITPGGITPKTDYKTGDDGKSGIASTIELKDNGNTFSYNAKGGKGGKGSIKTNEYLLCHIADLQSSDINKPCYYKTKTDNDFKKTHKIENGIFAGIKAIDAKKAKKSTSVPMSNELKNANPGMGAMGFGTESVSDFICEERHLDKVDRKRVQKGNKWVVEDKVTQEGVIKSGGEKNKLCDGNSKIKYILPNGADYVSGTGIVVVMW